MRPINHRPRSIEEAVDWVLAQLSSRGRWTIASLEADEISVRLHHGFGTWLRNRLLHPAEPELEAECVAILAAETAAHVAADPVLASVAAKFEALRPPPGSDDFSGIIIRRIWERLRHSVDGSRSS